MYPKNSKVLIGSYVKFNLKYIKILFKITNFEYFLLNDELGELRLINRSVSEMTQFV